jgi:transposase
VRFVCVACGHKTNADYNASLNIRDRCTFSESGTVTCRENSLLREQS